MATRQIKDAKDLTTNELIYFKGHAKATYMSDGRSVEDAIYSIGDEGVSAYPKVSHGTSDATYTLTPNVFHVWDGMETLTLILDTETDGVANEYLFQFTGGSGGTTLVLPDSIKWSDGAAPTIEAFKTYQVSILENCATYLCFE